jgi:hypothetical protein
MVNKVVDAFSRTPCIFSIISLKINLQERILSLQIDDDWYKDVKNNIGQETMMVRKYEGYSLDNDRLLIFNKRICVQPNDELRILILIEEHQEVYMAHMGVMNMRAYLNPLFFWKGMKADIASYVERSLECQQVKVEHRHPTGFL